MEFCREAGAGGNHLVAVAASGKRLGDGKGHRGHVLLREKELAPLLAEFHQLPEAERRPTLPDATRATPPKRPVPSPPEGGLILRGYCTYMKRDETGKPVRARRLYYEQNPDAWAAETQSDTLWLTADEWRSLLPGTRSKPYRVPDEIQRRLFSTLGIDYMEGSVNALPVVNSTLTVTPAGPGLLHLTGQATMGKALDEKSPEAPRSRGCRLEVVGEIRYQPTGAITAFDLAGVGQAWGNKMDYTRREIRLHEHPWHYGIAVELVPAATPAERIPPYNLLHYGGGMKYFGGGR